MPWQEVISHVSDARVTVRSKSGREYPVETDFDRIGRDVYERLHNRADTEHLRHEDDDDRLWGWIDFRDDGPVLEYLSSGSPYGGPPEKPPWDRP